MNRLATWLASLSLVLVATTALAPISTVALSVDGMT